jgi:hypothetical protein
VGERQRVVPLPGLGVAFQRGGERLRHFDLPAIAFWSNV